MSAALEERVMAALQTVQDPCSVATRRPLSIVELGLLVALDVQPTGDVRVALRVTAPSCMLIASIMEGAERQIRAVAGVRDVAVELDVSTDWTPDLMTPEGAAKLAVAREEAVRRLGARPRGRPVGGPSR